MSSKLTKELCKRIFVNTGFSSKTGLFSDMNLVKEKAILSDETGVENYIHFYSAEVFGMNPKVYFIGGNIAAENELEDLILLIRSGEKKEDVIVRHSDSGGLIMGRAGNDWVDLPIFRQLSITIAVEMIVQNGLSFTTTDREKELFSDIIEILG